MPPPSNLHKTGCHSLILMELVIFRPLSSPRDWPCHLPFPRRPSHFLPLQAPQHHPPSEPLVVPGSIVPSPVLFLEVVLAADYWPAMTPNVVTKELSLIKSLQEVPATQDTSGRPIP